MNRSVTIAAIFVMAIFGIFTNASADPTIQVRSTNRNGAIVNSTSEQVDLIRAITTANVNHGFDGATIEVYSRTHGEALMAGVNNIVISVRDNDGGYVSLTDPHQFDEAEQDTSGMLSLHLEANDEDFEFEANTAYSWLVTADFEEVPLTTYQFRLVFNNQDFPLANDHGFIELFEPEQFVMDLVFVVENSLYFAHYNNLRWDGGINEMEVSRTTGIAARRLEFNLETEFNSPVDITEITVYQGRVEFVDVDEREAKSLYDITYYPEEGRFIEPGMGPFMTIHFDGNSLRPGQRVMLVLSGANMAVAGGFRDLQCRSVTVERIREEQRGELQHFTAIHQSDQSHSVLVQQALVDHQPMSSGWEIGVISPAGILSGAGVWLEGEQLGFAVWGDDPMTDEVDGFREGEDILSGIRLWDPQINEESEVSTLQSRGDYDWRNDGLLIVDLIEETTDQVRLHLPFGWNMVSVNVFPGLDLYFEQDQELPSVQRMLDNRYITLVKDGQGRFWSQPNDFNNIPYWDVTQGYQVYVDSVNTGTNIFGRSIPPDTDIPLSAGWNMIAYFPDYELPIGADDFYAVSPILNNVIMVKDAQGNFALPAHNFSNMPDLRPGQGYKIKVRQQGVLNYPAEPNQGDAVHSAPILTNVHWVRPASTGSNMSVMVSGLKSGSEVGAFNKSGQLVGSGVTDSQGRCGLSVWGDDETTEMIDGLKAGEEFEIRIWNDSKESFIPKTLKYEVDGLEILEVDHKTLPFVKPVEFKLNEAFPNPFNSSTKIAFNLPTSSLTRLTVCDLTGREVARLFDGNLVSGAHSVIFDATGLPAGLYVVRLRSGELTANQRVLLVK